MNKKPRIILPARLTIPGRTRVPGTQHKWIRCAWDDCEKDGYDQIKVVVREPKKNLHYIFCSETHKQMHINGSRDYGNKG